MKDRPTTSNTGPSQSIEIDQENQEMISSPSLATNTENSESTSISKRRAARKTVLKTIPYEEKLLKILEDKQCETIDEDKNFSLMLVPMFKKLTDDQKHYAKIEILNIMKNAKNVGNPPVFYSSMQQSYSHLYPNRPVDQVQFPRSNFQQQQQGGNESIYSAPSTSTVNSAQSTPSATIFSDGDNAYFDLSNQ